VAKLAKLAAISASLRNASLNKQAGILGGIASLGGKAAMGAGKVALKNPRKVAVGVATGAGAVGQARQYKQGFDPNNG
jgi:hypothetical protein